MREYFPMCTGFHNTVNFNRQLKLVSEKLLPVLPEYS